MLTHQNKNLENVDNNNFFEPARGVEQHSIAQVALL
jgi:hypothetical protein